MNDLRKRLQNILRDILDDENIVITDEMSASDIPDWDSLAHLNIIIAVEKDLGIRFAAAEIAGLKKPGQNIGSFLKVIAQKRSA